MRRPLLVLAAAAAAVGPAPAGAAVPVLVIEGKGFGHGVGMAQDGAYWMGRGGASTAQILAQFYPGTRAGRAGGEVRVAVLSTTGSETVLGFPGGGEVRDTRGGSRAPGFPVRVPPGGRARVRFHAGRYTAEVVGGGRGPAPPVGRRAAGPATSTGTAGAARPAQEVPTTTTTTAPLLPLPGEPGLPPAPGTPPGGSVPTTAVGPAPTPPPAPGAGAPAPAPAPGSPQPLWAVPAGNGTVDVMDRGRRYRGIMEVGGGGALRLVNHVDVEQYLRGMGEVRDGRWPAASLRAQAVAARTYALRAMAGGGELCDTQQCQVYLGAQAEYAAMDKAVSATRGQVLLFGRSLASTVYSANGGGFSASTEEGFGTPAAGFPYLRPARYPTSDPSPWTVTVSLRDVAARVGYRGRITAVRAVAAGPSGRVLQVGIDGSAGPRTVSGIELDRSLGLRSTMFSVRVGSAEVAPPPPPADGGGVQALPGGGDVVAGDVAGGALDAVAATPGTAVITATPAAAPAPARRVVLLALAWLLLVAVGGGAAALRLGGGGPAVPVAGGAARRTARAHRPRRRGARAGNDIEQPAEPPAAEAEG